MRKTSIFLFTGLLLASGCAAERSPTGGNTALDRSESVVRTGIIEARPGYTGSKFGVEVEDVSVIDDRVQAVDLTLPFGVEEVDRIEVESVTGDFIDLPRQAEIGPGPDPKNTGIRIYLPKRKKWEFRIRIIDVPEDN